MELGKPEVGKYIKVDYDEMFKICVTNYIYCIRGKIDNIDFNQTDQTEYSLNTVFSNSAILFYWLILNSETPESLHIYRLDKCSGFKCPVLFIPLFEENNKIYGYPITSDTSNNLKLLFEQSGIVGIKCDVLEFDKNLCQYPKIKSTSELKKILDEINVPLNVLLNMSLEELAVFLIQKKRNIKNTKEFNFSKWFLGYCVAVFNNFFNNTRLEVEEQIKYLYFFMFLFFFDDICNIYQRDFILDFIDKYLPEIKTCFSIKISFNSNNTIEEIFLIIENNLKIIENSSKESSDNCSFFQGFQFLFEEAPNLFSDEQNDNGSSGIHQDFLRRYEMSYKAYQKLIDPENDIKK